MCGITGFIDTSRQSSKDILARMTDSLTHRGPDGSGIQLFNSDLAQVGLGHRRLSIIDLTDTGSQPMQLGKMWITFNGEIYNYAEIKNELSGLGHSFEGKSDSFCIAT